MTGAELERFLAGFARSGKSLGRCRAGERCGSPTVFAPCFRQALAALSGDEGGRALFRGREQETYDHEVPPALLRDYDSPWAVSYTHLWRWAPGRKWSALR